jgi:CheY-like chemotaxis protein
MGGTVGVESEEGTGSTFWFTAVLDRQPDGSAPPPVPALLRGKRVLVAAGDKTVRRVCLAYLQSWGLDVQTASDGNDAVSLLRGAQRASRRFHLVVLELRTLGEAVCRKIAADASSGRTAAVMVVRRGYHDELGPEKGSRGSVVTVPVRHAQLLKGILAALGEAPTAGGGKPAGRADADPNVAKRTCRILVAEDNPVNQKVAQRMLHKLGYRADTVANGLEVVQALDTIPYDLVLMDIQMPEMDGFEATKRIRQLEKEGSRHVPIVAMTAHAVKGYRERCLQAGMDAYLAKPIRREELARTLEAHLAVPAPAVASPDRTARAETGVFDKQALLARLEGDEAMMAEILRQFTDDFSRLLGQVKEALEARAAPSLTEGAHAIKGAAATIEAASVRDAAHRIESAGRRGSLASVAGLVADLEAAYGALAAALAREGLTP